MTNLKILALGALGGGQGNSAQISNSSALTMNDDILREVTAILGGLNHLESTSLVGNAKLTSKGGALADFVNRVGRRCKVGCR